MGLFAASRPRQIDIIDRAINFKLYKQLLQEENMKASIHKLKHKRMWLIQQEYNSRHTSH